MILYLSCTGNTLWAAQEAAERLGERLVNMASLTEDQPILTLQEGERLGFCFPVHGWRPPKLMRLLLQKVTFQFPSTPYVWALCTAGDNIGETMRLLDDDLKPHGLSLSAACSLIMPESYIGLPFMDVDTPEREAQKKSVAAALLHQFLYYINKNKRVWNLVEGHWPRLNSRLLGSYFLHRLITDKRFRVDADKCTRCGVCAKVCPVDNIEFSKGELPQWRHTDRCLTCFACYHHCAKRAIEFGRFTKGKGQYYFDRSSSKSHS